MWPYVSTVPSKWHHPCHIPNEPCQSPFSYQHVLTLTDNATEFESKVSQQRISGNLDSAEGGFDAIMQAAICKVRRRGLVYAHGEMRRDMVGMCTDNRLQRVVSNAYTGRASVMCRHTSMQMLSLFYLCYNWEAPYIQVCSKRVPSALY